MKYIYIFLFSLLSITSIAKAQETAEQISKESFLKAWEQAQKNYPTTVLFEKTDTPGIYNFETTLFPYKGRLELLNIVINEKINYYGNYDIQDFAVATGVAETALIDEKKESSCANNCSHSKDIWRNQQFLFFIQDAQKWMTEAEWENYIELQPKPKPKPKKHKNYKKYLSWYIALGLLILLYIYIYIYNNKYQKKWHQKYDASMQLQQEAIAITRESLDLQKQQIELLKKILEKR